MFSVVVIFVRLENVTNFCISLLLYAVKHTLVFKLPYVQLFASINKEIKCKNFKITFDSIFLLFLLIKDTYTKLKRKKKGGLNSIMESVSGM